jgi:tellurite resistance protein TerC
MPINNGFWIGFNVFVLIMLALDLGVLHKKTKEITVRQGLAWSALWIGLALVFNVLVYYWWGPVKAIEFFTGYLIEKALSVDNIFVFVLIFTSFKIPAAYQHRVLFWGIIGALVMRVIFIFAGVALLEKFHWMIYLFGGILVFTGYKMLVRNKESELEVAKNPVINFFKKFIPVTTELHGEKFFIRQNGKKWATPLFAVLILIETTDLIFAVDSIPAILAITKDPFIVYTSNVFAILGLRSLYFALAGIIQRFQYLSVGLAVVLIFVGLKMMLVDFYKIPITLSLGIIITILAVSILYSLKKTNQQRRNND